MKKRALSMCLAGTMLCGMMTFPAFGISVTQLHDVSQSDWFYPYVKFVAEKEFMVGVSDNEFGPQLKMTRAMFVTTLAKVDGVTAGGAETKFTDVAEDAWYAKAVNWATERNIVAGVSSTRFDPDTPITREQMCVIMNAFVNYWAEKEDKTYYYTVPERIFPDADQISDYATEAVKSCQRWGLVAGDQNGNFNPKNDSTRAEVATVVKQLFTLLGITESSSGGGGGGGGGGSFSYQFTATLDVPDSLKTQLGVALSATADLQTSAYSERTQKTMSDIAQALVSGNENENAIVNYVDAVLDAAMGREFSQAVNGQTMTVKISDAGVISATTVVKVTDLNKTRATVEEMEDLIGRLQNGQPITRDDADVLQDIITKAEELDGMTEAEVQGKIDAYVAENPDLEKALEGMTPAAVKEAAKDYKEQLVVVQEKVEALPVDETLTVEPVSMVVAVDLTKYLATAQDTLTNNESKYLTKLEKQLGIELNDARAEAAKAVYWMNNPEDYVIQNQTNGTLTLKDADAYLALIQEYTKATCAFYKTLPSETEFYQDLLDRLIAQDKVQGDINTGFAAMMADEDKDGILGDELNASGTLFDLEFTGDESVYERLVNLLSGNIESAGSMLPGTMPDVLTDLIGGYQVTLKATKS